VKYTIISAMLLLVHVRPAAAEISFICDAAPGNECAFSVVDARGGGTTNFVLGPKEKHGLNDNFAGGKYCVVVSKPRAQVTGFPPDCKDAKDPSRAGKVVSNITPGGTYWGS
jgi:hypothetical protein